MIQAVIFDLDGTLLYTLDSIALSCNKVLAAHALPSVTHEQLKHFVGDGVIDLMKRAFAASGSTEAVGDTIVSEFRACFKDDCDFHVVPYEGINEVLKSLKENGVKIGCNTNKPHENAEKLIRKHFGTLFDGVQGNVSEIPKKPDPAGAARLLERFGVSPQAAVYIGDSDVDMLTAQRLGCLGIGAGWGYRGETELLQSGAAAVAKEPKELINLAKCRK